MHKLSKLPTDRDTALLLRCEIVKYLDGCGHLKELEVETKKYLILLKNAGNRYPPFNFPIRLDYMDLLDKSAVLASWLAREPSAVRGAFRDVVHECVRAAQAGQVHVPLRVGAAGGALARLGGFVLQAVERSVSYVNQSAWKCLEDCENSDLVVPCIPEKAPLCAGCKTAMVEMQTGRDHGTTALAAFLDPVAVRHRAGGDSAAVFAENVWVCDEMIEQLVLGRSYDVTVMVSGRKLLAWDVDTRRAPASLRGRAELHEDYAWSACARASWAVAEGLVPPGTFMPLCMGLLLSLASIQEEEDGFPLQVLALGPDYTFTNRIMKKMSQLARRVTYGRTDCLPAGEPRRGRREAGALVLARGGVCLLGNWALHVHSPRSAILLSAVASGKIKLDGDQSGYLPLKASAWTYWDIQRQGKELSQVSTLHNLFGIAFPAFEEDTDRLADHVLDQGAKPGTGRPRETPSERDLARLFRETARWKVTMDPGAETLMRDYFLALRRDRPDEVPLRALSVLDKLSRANARLSLRTVAARGDVLLAACLYQRSLTMLYGESVLPDPQIGGMQNANDVKIAMDQFGKWLDVYIENFKSDSAVSQM